MKRWRVLVVVIALFLLVPGVTAAQAERDEDGFIFRVNGTTVVGAEEVLDGVVAVSGDAVVDGHLTGGLWVIDGTATVHGRVDGDVMVVDGILELPASARVENVTLVRSELERNPGATIAGELDERSEFVHFGWGWTVFSVVFWLGATVVVLAGGLAFAWFARRQLTEAGSALTQRLGESLVTAALLWVGLPLAAVAVIVTLVGIPLGIALLVAVLPALWFLGYLVAGARLGEEIGRRFGVGATSARPYLAVVAGLLALQVVGLVPFIGGAVVFIAGFLGSGALVYRAARGRREERRVAARTEPVPTT